MYISTIAVGFSLLEVLIAMLVLTIGLLGLTDLQINSVIQSRHLYYYNQASLITHALAEQLPSTPACSTTNDILTCQNQCLPKLWCEQINALPIGKLGIGVGLQYNTEQNTVLITTQWLEGSRLYRYRFAAAL